MTWIKISFNDSSNKNKIAFLNARDKIHNWDDNNRTNDIFEYLYSWWQDSLEITESEQIIIEDNKDEIDSDIKFESIPELDLDEECDDIFDSESVSWVDDELEFEDLLYDIDYKIDNYNEPITYPKQNGDSIEQEKYKNNTNVSSLSKEIEVSSAINYEHAKISYKVKIENNSSSSISDITVKPFIPEDILYIDQNEKNISLIKKGEAKTTTFTLRPKGECGNVDISGKLKYYDTKRDEYIDISINPIQTRIICPMLKVKPIEEHHLRAHICNLISIKEITNDIPLPAGELFEIITDVIKDINMYMLQPKISNTRYVARFYSEGIKGLINNISKKILENNFYNSSKNFFIVFLSSSVRYW